MADRVRALTSTPRGAKGLFAAAAAGWIATERVGVTAVFHADQFRSALVWDGVPGVGLLPSILMLLGGILVLAGREEVEDTRRAGWVLAGLVLARLVSFAGPVGWLFPWSTLLWSPAVSWGTTLFAVCWPLAGRLRAATRVAPTRSAVVLGVVLAVVYGAYGLYFVKTTPLHGDEPQYLLIAQSLLEHGDIDLADADEARKLDFHAFDFDVHKAPASPPGRIHSTHPSGMPALLTIPYAIGDRLWGHPRLAAVLLQTTLTAAAVGLLIPVLVRLGTSLPVAGLSATVVGLSVPAFSQSNQLYPEVHAVLAGALVLSLFPRWPKGRVDVTTGGLVAACAAIVLLPFFHQRHLILSVVLAIPVADTIRRAGYASSLGRAAIGVFGAGLIAHLVYNWHYSGDPFGPFLPGNADVLGPDFTRSIPGQWIDRRQGLLRLAPVLAVTLFGFVRLALSDRRRLILPAAILAATMGVNTLSSDWTFGFCVPARFAVAALPALAIGLAAGFDWIVAERRAVAGWLAACGFVIGGETLVQNAILPETGFKGLNLGSRLSEAFYPSAVHFTDAVSGELDPGAVAFWAVVIAAMVLTLRGRRGVWLAAFGPFLVAGGVAYDDVMGGTWAYQVPRHTDDPRSYEYPKVEVAFPLEPVGRGVFRSDVLPLFRGRVTVAPRLPIVEGASGVRAFNTYVNTTDGLKRSGYRRSIPLINSLEQSAHTFVTQGTAVSKQFHYAFDTGVTPEATQWTLVAAPMPERRTVFHEDVSHFPSDRPVIVTLDGFRAGDYELALERDGIPWSDWFTRGQAGTVVGIFTGFERVRTVPEGLAGMGQRWLEEGWRDPTLPLTDAYFPPQVEARVPFFWSFLPEAWDRSPTPFSLERDGPVHFVIVPARDVRVTGLRIDRLEAVDAGMGGANEEGRR